MSTTTDSYYNDTTQELFTVVYSHKHGTDAWACESEDVAWLTIINCIENYLGDVEGKARKRIERLIAARDWPEATAAYEEASGDREYFIINGPTPLARRVTAIQAMEEAVEGSDDGQ